MRAAAMQGTRMIPLAEALAWVGRSVSGLGAERIGLTAAAGRVLAADLPALPATPSFAAIDGYAVRATETQGASDYAPLPLAAVPIVAGATLPSGTDAVLPLHLFENGCALGAVAPGEGVGPADGLGIEAGTVLRPSHLAALALRGLAEAEVVRRPSVALRVAGPKSGADALTPMLRALIDAEGGVLGEPDLVLLAGRSGPGPDDEGIRALDSIFAHGVGIRPGETSALGTVGRVPALLLPGEPLACAIAFALLAAPALRRLGRRPEAAPVTATLTRKIVSGLGQVDAVRVRLAEGQATPLPPTLSMAADGLVLAAEGSEGYPAGASVAIYPLA